MPCTAAGTFTTNRVKAAPVIWDRDIVRGSDAKVSAVVVTSGDANACTGELGLSYCKKTAEAGAEVFGVPENAVLVASTGVIGQQIPIDKITAGVKVLSGTLGSSREKGHEAALAIMTTDTVPKEAAVRVSFSDGSEAVIGGCCKGSGMIHPNMCTMLAFLATDAAISKEMLQKALSGIVPDTFNMVSVDGDTSTNDTCLLLANGLPGTRGHKGARKEARALGCILHTDEGGHRRPRRELGPDPCAMGYSGASFDPEKVDLWFESAAGKLQIVKDGSAAPYSEEEATKILSESEVTATGDLKAGTAAAAAWGCDLTHEYVKINADYRS